jgi:hypothetical protein
MVSRRLLTSLQRAAAENQGSLAAEIRRRLVQDFEVRRAVAPPGERAQSSNPAGTPAGLAMRNDGAVEAGGAQRNGQSEEEEES